MRVVLRENLPTTSFCKGKLPLDPTAPSLDEIGSEHVKADYDFSKPGQCHISSTARVFVAPVGIARIHRRHTGIILRKRPDESLYERIGYVELTYRDAIMMPAERMRNMSNIDRIPAEVEVETMNIVNFILTSLPLCNVKIV